MRYMGWSYLDLMTCPVEYLQVIVEVAQEESSEQDNRRRSLRR